MKTAINKIKIMKTKILLQTLFLFVSIQIFSQNPIIPITDDPSKEVPEGAYLKDINNDLDKFTGTWRYTQGTDTLTIVIEKVIEAFNDDYYEDEIRGRYKYINNGNTIIDNNDSLQEPLIFGNVFLSNVNELSPAIYDPERKRLSYNLKLTYTTVRDINSGLTVIQLNWDLKITAVGYCGPYPNQPTPSPQDCLSDNRLPLSATLTKID
jgi:hypothetical protein